MSSMICAAVNGGIAITINQELISITHTKIGIRVNVMPGQRIEIVVTITLIALATLPIPAVRMPNIQKSVLAPRENGFNVSGAYANHPTSGAEPCPDKPPPPM